MNPYTEEHELFRKTFRNFIEKEITPHAQEWEEARGFPREIFKRFGELGYLGLNHPEEYGGLDLDYWYTVIYAEELCRSTMAGFNMNFMVQTDMATPAIRELGTDEQKKEFLEPAIRGDAIAALGVTEPGCGSDVAAISTYAKKDGDDYIINGAKTFITNGTRADFITLAVKTTEEGGHGGLSFFLFPTDTKGYTVGRKLKKMGNHSSDTAELSFEDCRVPKRYLLGEENHGFLYIMRNFQGERLIAAIAAVAGSALLLENTIEYCKSRHAFGRPISKFQVNRHKIVDMATEIAVSRSFIYDCCEKFNRKEECVTEVSMAKLYAGSMAIRVADECVQLHGGYGYIDEYPVSRAYRDVRLITIGGGTNEVMKEIIAKMIGV